MPKDIRLELIVDSKLPVDVWKVVVRLYMSTVIDSVSRPTPAGIDTSPHATPFMMRSVENGMESSLEFGWPFPVCAH